MGCRLWGRTELDTTGDLAAAAEWETLLELKESSAQGRTNADQGSPGNKEWARGLAGRLLVECLMYTG